MSEHILYLKYVGTNKLLYYALVLFLRAINT